MQPGRMNQGFVVQRERRVKSDGEYLSEWSNIHDLSGEVTYQDQKEGVDGEQKRAVERIKIRTWDVGVKAVDRVIFDGYVWDIDSVKPWGIQNDFYVEIEATKTDAQDEYNESAIGLKFLSILKSYDSGVDEDFFDVIWSSTLGMYIAVGNSVIATSLDGVNWLKATIPNESASFRAISENNGTLIAVGVNTLPHRSTDGVNWSQITGSPTGQFYGCTFANNRFVAVGNRKVIYSLDDGLNWYEQSIANTYTWKDVTYNNVIGRFVAISNNGYVMTSLFGNSSWSLYFAFNEQFESVCFSKDKNLLVAVGHDGVIMTSSNISEWALSTVPNSNDYIDVIYDEDLSVFVCVSVNGFKQVITSSDGIDWQENEALDSNNYISAITYSGTLKQCVAVTERSNGLFYKSKYNRFLEEV
jgi:hypothetical protein